MALSTRCVRSYTGTAITPLGKDLLICSSLLATACETVRLFSPINMNTVPSTTSRPFSVAAPLRNSRPISTLATFFTRIGVPSTLAMTMLAMSSVLATCPGARISNCSPLRSMYPAPTLALLRSSAVIRSVRVSLYAARRFGSGAIWYSLANPPMVLISATPGTLRNCGLMIQS